MLKPGQLTTGRKQLSVNSGISESKVERILNAFETAHQIEQQKTTKNRLITIVNWAKYQDDEQQIKQQTNNDRTTSEQRANTLKEYKKERNKEIEAAPPQFSPSGMENERTAGLIETGSDPDDEYYKQRGGY